jgi:hypothetical protein
MRTGPEELRDRTKAFAVRIVKLYRSLPHTGDSQVLDKQLALWHVGCGELSSGMQGEI